MPPTRRRPYTPRMPPDQRRQQLLDAALEIIARDGYAGVSIDAIAREAKVTRPVVYGVFDGLGSLLYALLDRQEKRALSQLMSVMPDFSNAAPDALIVDAIRRLIDTVRQDPLTWRPILLAPEGTPAAVQERISADRELVRTRLEALLGIGIALRGRPTIDIEVASHALIGVAEYFGRLIIVAPETFTTDRLVEAIEGLLAMLDL